MKRGLVVLLAMPLASGAIAGATADGLEIADELKALEDPSIFKRRVWLDTEWSSFKNSSDDVVLTFGAQWAWAASANHDWAVRIKVLAGPINGLLYDVGKEIGYVSIVHEGQQLSGSSTCVI